jgi:hypothetical protein
MVLAKTEVKTTRIFDNITGNMKNDIDIGVTNIEDELYLCC